MKKNRIPIPKSIAAEVLFLSDRTCCVCNDRGKNVQIHHIDENPSNNEKSNLAILCFDCHNETMVKGGFGRALETNQVILYRDEWLFRVNQRKMKADELASIHSVTGLTENNIIINVDSGIEFEINKNLDLLIDYLKNIQPIHNAQLLISRSKWDSGITVKMNEGNSNLIAFYEEVLSELATFFSPGQFQNKTPEQFFYELISYKFAWHWALNEPLGIGTGGRMASTITGGRVISELQDMIVEMTKTLVEVYRIEKELKNVDWEEVWKNTK